MRTSRGLGKNMVSFMGFGRKAFGRRGLADAQLQAKQSGRIFGERDASSTGSSFDRFFDQLQRETDLDTASSYQHYRNSKVMESLSAEERGELLADLADRPGIHDGYSDGKSNREKAAYNAHYSIWQNEIEVGKEHIGALLTLLLGNKPLREKSYLETQFITIMKLIDSAIKKGGYLSKRDCAALADMAADIRNGHRSYSKADIKKMIARAEKVEKLAGVEVSATEFLMQRCEGADNPWAIAPGERDNAQFWADLLAETTIALEEIREGSKSGGKPAWMRNATDFAAAWPAVGEVVPQFGAWENDGKSFSTLSQHNGKRTGFADPAAYRSLPRSIALAQPHSRYIWKSDQIPGLDVLADLENSDWTALVEQLITQRRATKATAAWQKEVLALCQPLGLETVESRLHDWLALFHSPALDMAAFTEVSNGERFASTIDRLDEAHPDWPGRHANEIPALARAVAMVVASHSRHHLCGALHTQLIRTDDHVYKNTRVTEGILGLLKAQYKRADGSSTYESLGSWMRLSVENEEFLRGAVWLVALMPDRVRAIEALEKVAQTAATYMWTGDDGMRSKIIANAAIATLIAMGGSDIDQVVLRLSKVIENCTINPPLFKHLNRRS
jgi:hypothetical protein